MSLKAFKLSFVILSVSAPNLKMALKNLEARIARLMLMLSVDRVQVVIFSH
jgi:hypothetical protein